MIGLVTDARLGIEAVRARIAAAAERAGRSPGDVTLVAVTKGVPADRLRAVVPEHGVLDLGENRAQELLDKQASIAAPAVRWHFIGTLQRNKVRAVVGRVAMIHSIDSVAIADAVAGRAGAHDIRVDILLQVNTSGETTKHGVDPADAEAVADAIAALPGLRLRGLMTIARPDDLEAARASFRTLRALRDRIGTRHPDVRDLSMGMTSDFEIAVEEGATIVRVGSAIFGERMHH